MLYFVEHIFLRHKLRKLVGGKKFLNSRLERPLIDYGNWHSGVHIDNGHPVLNIALDLHHTRADFLLQGFAHKTYSSLTQVVNVIGLGTRSGIQRDYMNNDGYQVLFGNNPARELYFIRRKLKALVETEAAHRRQIIALRRKK